MSYDEILLLLLLDRQINNNNPFRQNLQPTEERPASSDPTLETRNNLANIEEQSPEENMRTGDINATLSAEEKQAIKLLLEKVSSGQLEPGLATGVGALILTWRKVLIVVG